MALVAVAALRRGGTGSLASILRTRLIPFGAGVVGVLAAVTALYASWGAAGALIDDMFFLPLTLESYAVPVELPPPGSALAASGLLAAVAAGLLGLGGRRRAAGGMAAAAGIALAIGLAQSGASPLDWGLRGAGPLRGIQPSVLAWAGLATLAPLLLGARPPERPDTVAWLALAFLHVCLAFQGFPRAGPDLHLAQGAQMLLPAALLSTWYRQTCSGAARRASRAAAALLLALVPLWLVLPPVAGVLRGVASKEAFRELRFPQAKGIRLPRVAIERLGIEDMERVSAYLAAQPGADPVLLLGNQEVIVFASGRPSLLPRWRAHLFWIAWGLGSRRDPQALEAKVLRSLEASPAALVVDCADPSARRLRRTLPRLSAHLDQHYRVRERVGRYRILARAAGREPPHPEAARVRPDESGGDAGPETAG